MEDCKDGQNDEIQVVITNCSSATLDQATQNSNKHPGIIHQAPQNSNKDIVISDVIEIRNREQENCNAEQNKKKESFLKYFFRPPKRWDFHIFASKRFLLSSNMSFKRLAEERDLVSRSFMSPPQGPLQSLRDGFNMPFVGEIRWAFLRKTTKEWLRNPKNLALLIWGIGVAISGAILFMVMVGMLNHVLPKKSQRDTCFEISNQILNALFTMMCLYQHPQRFYHLALLIRWEKKDILILRNVYCKNGTYKPHEWAHMMLVVLLLQLNCFAQYALCGLNWGYKRSDRPALGVGLCLALAIGAPAVAGLYLILSPLGKDFDYEEDVIGEATTVEDTSKIEGLRSSKSPLTLLERRYSLVPKDGERLNFRPEWQGGIFECWKDPEVAFFSTFCGFCVFGWNMDRLGLGNMYVQIFTFVLLCMAPFWIFNLAAINIDNVDVRTALGISGIVLCAFGLLYGGFWRTQMRKKFGLPANRWCFGHASLTDYVQWLFCSICSLCQEVRTGSHYGLYYDKLQSQRYFIRSPVNGSEASSQVSGLSHEEGSHLHADTLMTPPWSSPVISAKGSPSVQWASPYKDVELRSPELFMKETNGPLPSPSELENKQIISASMEGKPGNEAQPMKAPAPLIITREDFD